MASWSLIKPAQMKLVARSTIVNTFFIVRSDRYGWKCLEKIDLSLLVLLGITKVKTSFFTT